MQTGLPDTVEAWELQDRESLEAYEAFTTYRDLGPVRSLTKVAEQLGKSTPLMSRWSSRWEWVRRCVAWDRYQARLINEELVYGKAEARVRIANEAIAMASLATERFASMTDREIAMLRPMEVVALFRTASAIEMQMRNIPESELESAECGNLPVFHIHFLKGKPDGFVTVRVSDMGQTGYIPNENLGAFLAAYPDAEVLP